MANYYLTGMMGSGKSVTGKKLAQKLGCVFVDLDEWLQEKAGKTIVEIFAKQGEAAFRDLEAQSLKEVSKLGNRVVATGGGIVLRPANVELMKATGKVIFLETSPQVLWDRVKDKRERPLLNSEDPHQKLMDIFAHRKSIYETSSDVRVNTDGKTAGRVADEIFELLGSLRS